MEIPCSRPFIAFGAYCEYKNQNRFRESHLLFLTVLHQKYEMTPEMDLLMCACSSASGCKLTPRLQGCTWHKVTHVGEGAHLNPQ